LRSRFFDELPEQSLKWITPKQVGFGSVSAPRWGAGAQHAAASWPTPERERQIEVTSKAPSGDLRTGMRVFHNKFGEGQVLTLEGAGEDARAQVNFNRHGLKWLALSVAKLTPLDASP
ncbi:MAG: DNA helicase II, partial [Hylemonella sp.]